MARRTYTRRQNHFSPHAFTDAAESFEAQTSLIQNDKNSFVYSYS